MSERIRVAILGGTGYGAGELMRLLTQHPQAEVVSVTSTSQVGEPIHAAHPHLRGFYDLKLTERVDFDRLNGERCVAISALPNGASSRAIDELLRAASEHAISRHLRVIDLSGDFRLSADQLRREFYPDAVASERTSGFQYGMPELFRDRIRNAKHIANPGCLATASILACAPLISSGFNGTVAIDAKTGSSGSGRQLKETTHHPTRHGDFRAYKPLAHQHEPEILQACGDPRGERIQLSFVAQSMDVSRGIFVTAHMTLAKETNTTELIEKYRSFYRESSFIRIVDESPALQNVVGSNFCDIAIATRGKQVIAMAAIDNLVKGMSGTAIQNMNLMFGESETMGLWTPSFRPV